MPDCLSMGSRIEINDTLCISKERGFPVDLQLEDHLANAEASERFVGKEFQFWKVDERLYHRPPLRVFLVEEISGRWLFWGHALILEQTIKPGRTEGKYLITKLYSPDYQRLATIHEAPEGRGYF